MSRSLNRLLVSAVLLAAAARAWAAPTLRHQEQVNGDFTLIGNTLAHDCASGATPVVGTVGACGSNATDSGVDIFWQSNPGAGTAAANSGITLASSQSTAALDTSSLPAGATVTYARVYWAAHNGSNAYGPSATLRTPDNVTHALTADALASKVVNTGGYGYWYQSSADVTAVLQALATPYGKYTMSGVTSVNIVGVSDETTFDAWWMVIFYRDPADTALRQLTLFDGLDFVTNTAPGNVVDVTLGGFLVPNGGWDAKLGVITYEGDASVTGDSLLFQGYQSTSPEPTILTTLADAQNPANNFFNGTRSWLGAARSVSGDLPQYAGTPGSMQSFDMDVVDLKALGAIHGGDDSAKIRARSSQDVFALGAFITSINTLKPSFANTVKTAANLTRGSGVFAGDLIEYTIDTQNTGNDPSIQTVLQDALPVGVTYVPGTIQITQGANAGSMSDAAGDDQAEYVSSTRTLVVRLGNGATAWVGGTMAIGDRAQVKFRVTVDAGASGIIQNLAQVIGAGQSGEPPRTFESNPPIGTGPTDLPVDQCSSDAQCGGSTPACLASASPTVCVGCTSNAYCGGVTPICDLAAHACAGVTTIAPAAQDETTVAGAFAPFAMTLTSHLSSAETYDLDVVDGGCGWGVELRTSGGTLVGTRSTGGVWTIAGGGDTDGDGKPDLGPTAAGGSTSFVLRLTPPPGTPVGTSCSATVVATGHANPGVVALAGATLHVGPEATWTPAYTGAAAKIVSRGGDVGFSGVIQNNTSGPLTFSLAATVTANPAQGTPQAATFYSDPNGDGDPSDGAPITAVGPIPAYGGQAHVVLVLHALNAVGTAFTTGTVLDASSTATTGGVVATQASEAKVQYGATYSDSGRTLVRGVFAPCDTIYFGASLLPSGSPFALEWYAKASPVRGTDTPFRVVDPWAVSGGSGSDQLQLPANALGTWTVLVVQKTTPTATVLDTVTFQVERSGAFASFAVPSRIRMTDGLSVSASVQNQNGTAALSASQLAYTVTSGPLYMGGAGAFSTTAGLAHLTAPVTVPAGATAADAWVVAAPAWPAPGTYQVDAEWQLQCGGVTQAIAPATTSFEVAPAAPVITAPAAGALLSTRTPAFSGTGLAGASVTVTVGSTSCGPVVVGGGGAWSCFLGSSLADGPYSATAVQTYSGAASDASAAVAFTVDGTPPAVAITTPSAGALLGASAAPGGVVSLSGTAEAGATVVLSAGSASAAASRSGTSWSATLTLADGPWTATATATDAAGNSASAQVGFTLDTTPPAAPVIGAPANGAAVDAASAPGGFVSVSGTAEAGASVTVTVDGAVHVATRAGTTWTTTFALADGAHAVSAIATDAAGNASPAGTSGFTLDTAAPLAPSFAFPLDGALLAAGQAPGGVLTLTGGTEAGSLVAVTVDGASHAATVSGAGWSLTLALGDGLHPASAVAADAAGNLSPPTAISFRIDATPPAAPVLGAIATPTHADPVPVGGTAEAGATVELFLDGVSQGTAVAGPSFAFSLAGVGAGAHSVVAVASDAAGNASGPSAAQGFVVDRTPPGLPTVDAPADAAALGAAQAPGGAVTFSGTSEAGSAVEIEVDGNVLGIAAAPAGSWSVTLALVDGAHQVRARATDAAGNVGGWTASSAFTLDTSGPLAPVLDALASPTSASPVTVTGVAELGATVSIYVDGVLAGTAAAPLGAFSLDLVLGEGSCAITAIATDATGNASAPSGPVALVVDRTAPAAPVLDPLVTPTSAVSVPVTGTAEVGATVTVYRDGVAVGTAPAPAGAFSLSVPVFDGPVTFTATAADAAGNVSIPSSPVAIQVDHSVPAAPVLDPVVTPTNAIAVAVSGSADAGTAVILYRDGLPVAAVAAPAGVFSVVVPVDPGTVTFSAVAVNGVGTASAASAPVVIVVDRVPPDAPVLGALDSPTGASTVTVAGSAEAGSHVTIFEDGAPIGGVVAGPAGAFALDVGVGEGTFTFTAIAVDDAGNASLASSPVTEVVDHTLPAPPVLAALASPTSVTTLVVSGTAEAGSAVTILEGGAPVGAAVAAADGTFSLPLAVPEGALAFTATSRDAAGNVSAQSATVFVTVDRTAPDAPVLLAPAAGAVLGAAAAPGGVVTFSGTAEPSSVLELEVDGASTTLSAGSGSWAAARALADGAHQVRARASDAAGNVGPWTVAPFTVDTVAPAAPSLDPLASPTNATSVLVTGRAEAGATVTIRRGGTSVGTVSAAAGAFSLSVPVGEGTFTFTATAADAAGNVSGASNAVSVIVDRSAPLAPVLDALATPTRAAAVTVTGSAEAGATVAVFLDGVQVATATAVAGFFTAADLPVAEGTRTFTARAIDPAGNASPLSAPVAILVDRTPPAAPVLAALVTPTNATTITVSGTAEAGATVTLFRNGASVGAGVAAGGAFAFPLAVPEGGSTFTAIATDAAGNGSGLSNAVTVLVDRTPPGLATVDAPADGAALGGAQAPGGAVAFFGTSEAGGTVEVEVDGVVRTIAASPAGPWSATFAVVDGVHGVRVRATDAAGNAGPWSLVSSFSVDTAGPLAPVLDALATPTSAASVTATGVAEPGALVAVYVDGVLAATVLAPAGAFSLDLVLDEGAHAITAVATDAAGNASALSAAIPVVVDRTAPAAPVLDPLVTPTGATSVAVTGTTDAGTAVTVYRDGVAVGTAPESGGRFQLAVAVSEGDRTFTATAADAAGNVSPLSNAVTVSVDRTAPPAPILDPLVTPTNATSVVVTGSADAGVTVTVYRDGAAVATAPESGGRFAAAVPVPEGSFAFTATAADAAGNVSPLSGAVPLVVDRSAPAAPVLDPLVTPTNAVSVTLSGSADAGTTVTVYRDGVAFATVAAPAGGFSVTVPVFGGTVTFAAVATDAAGNASGLSNAVVAVVDHDAPAAPVLDPLVTPTNAVAAVVTGLADAGAVVTVFLGGVPAGLVAAGADGTFSLAIAVPEGTSTFTAVATDAAGNVSAGSNAVSVVTDRIAPDAPLLAPLESPTGASTVSLAGSAEAGARIALLLDGVPVATTVATDGTFVVDVGVTDGLRSFVATATDAAGNVSADSNTVTVLVDHTLPAPPVLAALASPTSATTVAVSGIAGAGTTVTIYLDAVGVASAAAADGTFSAEVALPEGNHRLTARSKNLAGDVSAISNTVLVTVDRTAPAAPVVTAPAGGSILGGAAAPGGAVQFAGSAEAGSTVELDVDGASTTFAAGAGSWSVARVLPDGAHLVRARATDPLGNVGPWSAPSSFALDTVAPAAPVLDPLGAPTSAPTVVVTGRAEPGATVTIRRDGTIVGSAVASGGGTFSLPVGLASEGAFGFSATAADAAGNVSGPSSAVSVTVDRTAPGAPSISTPASGATLAAGQVRVAGVAEPNATVRVVVDGVTYTAVADAGGAFSVSATLPAGTWTATATATDAAANVSAATAVTFTTGGAVVPGPHPIAAHVVGGGCGCGPGAGAPASALLFVLLALALAPRRRRGAGAR